MDEFITCDKCMEVYDGELRCPRMFTCGHSFCSSCIQKLLTTSSFCPTCKEPVENESMESISINFILKQIVEKYLVMSLNDPSGSIVKEQSKGTRQRQRKSLPKSNCKDHKVPKRFRCMTCNMWICGDCVAISHKLCKTLLVKEAIEEMKKENNNKISEHLAMISESEDDPINLGGYYTDILVVKKEQLQCYLQKVDDLKKEIGEVEQIIKKVSGLGTDLDSLKKKLECQMKVITDATSANDLDKIEEKLTEHFSSLKKFIKDLKFYKSAMLQDAGNENKDSFNSKEKLMASVTAGERILVTANKDGITKYGELDVKEGLFRIHSMQQTNNSPSSLCITLDNCLITMTGRKEWPTKIFLQFSSDGVPFGDCIIRLQESLKEALKTVLSSCLFGEEGKSFKGVRLRGNLKDFIWSKDWLSVPSDVDGEALLKEKKKKKWNEGEMGLNVFNWNNGMEFVFWICVKESYLEWELIPTGQMEKGIEVIKDACRRSVRGEEVKVLNCGWVLN